MELMEIKSQKNNIREFFPVTGMTCAGCAISVESILKSTKGVSDAGVNFANQTAWAEFDSTETNLTELQKSVRAVGYNIIVNVENPEEVQEENQLKAYQETKHRTIWTAILALPVFLIGMFFMDMPYANWISMALTIPVLFWFGRIYFINAWKQATFAKANMDTLVALSTGIAFIFSAFNTIYPQFWTSRGVMPHVYFEAAAVIIAFISLGKMLEEKAKTNTSSAIRKLIGLQPKTVKIVQGDVETEIAVELVEKGNIIILRPGEKVPVDGTVKSGSTYIDESMITGEPVAVLKTAGERVFTGTINQKGSIQFLAEKVGSETYLAQIIETVRQAQGSKAPVQKLVDKIAGIFVPVVLAVSVITFVIWMLVGGENAFTHALLTSVTVLVIACPCALGLATPTAIMVGVGKGAENHMLIKDAESLETAHRVNAVILDKTGTITEGKPVVNSMFWRSGIADIDELKRILYSLESKSEHPLAEAVVRILADEKQAAINLDAFESITAKGVKATYKDKFYFVGNNALLEENNIPVNLDDDMSQLAASQDANTIIYFANNEQVLCVISIADKIKATSKAAIQTLQEMNIEVFMLTGDNQLTATAVAAEVGIKEFKASVLPQDKAQFVKDLQAKGKVVAMVGDGINDSEALAQADISIAMGRGSDIAMDVAKITLITSDLQSIAKVLKLSKKTVATIYQNLFWAFIYNLIGIPIAAGALYYFNGFLLNPMIAGGAMALSSVSVVMNSLTLKNSKL